MDVWFVGRECRCLALDRRWRVVGEIAHTHPAPDVQLVDDGARFGFDRAHEARHLLGGPSERFELEDL